jgi:signal transduction histidine kinase
LGLAIVKKIVEAHGGRIEVAAPQGAGAKFTVTLRGEG